MHLKIESEEIIIYHANGCEKKAGIAVLILDKIDSKTKIVTRQRRALCNHKGTNPERI